MIIALAFLPSQSSSKNEKMMQPVKIHYGATSISVVVPPAERRTDLSDAKRHLQRRALGASVLRGARGKNRSGPSVGREEGDGGVDVGDVDGARFDDEDVEPDVSVGGVSH